MMRFVITLTLFFTVIPSLLSQNRICLRISQLDSIISRYDSHHGNYYNDRHHCLEIDNARLFEYRSVPTVQDAIRKDSLVNFAMYIVRLMGIGTEPFDPRQINMYLSCIQSVETITWVEYVLDRQLFEIENSDQIVLYTNEYFNHDVIKDALKLVQKRVDELIARNFSLYRYTESSKAPLKFVYVDHSNDFFSIHNDDRDMTGGFRIELGTDWLKMRLLGSKWFLSFNSRSWYSYQSLVIGGEGYTPFLRDTFIFTNDFSYDTLDRPFASFNYVGRAKYRIYRHGQFRMFSQFKLGSIGSNSPKGIQSALHRDVTIGSSRPNGWGAQIAAGGRIAFSYEVVPEYMILSRNWFLTHPISRNWTNFLNDWINLSVLLECRVGHEMTSLGYGFGFSTMNFKKQGGIGLPFLPKRKKRLLGFIQENILFSYRYTKRYVFHNSMLEGYGVFKHAVDEDPTSPIDRWFLQGDQINRWVHIHQFTLNFGLRYCGIVFRQTFYSPEFNLPVNRIAYPTPNPDNITPGNHNRSPWNHVGTIGLVFKVGK